MASKPAKQTVSFWTQNRKINLKHCRRVPRRRRKRRHRALQPSHKRAARKFMIPDPWSLISDLQWGRQHCWEGQAGQGWLEEGKLRISQVRFLIFDLSDLNLLQTKEIGNYSQAAKKKGTEMDLRSKINLPYLQWNPLGIDFYFKSIDSFSTTHKMEIPQTCVIKMWIIASPFVALWSFTQYCICLFSMGNQWFQHLVITSECSST